MKTAPAKRKAARPSASETGQDETPPDVEPLLARIATAAYFKAEARGFAPGGELQDWLAAEREVAEQLE